MGGCDLSAGAEAGAYVKPVLHRARCKAGAATDRTHRIVGRLFRKLRREANEGMIKLARKYSFDKYGKGRDRIVTLYQSFHGRTITTLAATGQDNYHNYFFPFTEGFSHAKANDIDDVKSAVGEQTCAVMIELIRARAAFCR